VPSSGSKKEEKGTDRFRKPARGLDISGLSLSGSPSCSRNDNNLITLTHAILADSAKVREGLLFLIAGGIERVTLSQIPGPLNASLALGFTGTKQDLAVPHDLEVRFIDIDGRPMPNIATMKQTFPPIDIGESAEGHLNAILELQSVLVVPGQFFIDVLFDGKSMRRLPLNIMVGVAA
jgi:hypothetical protein